MRVFLQRSKQSFMCSTQDFGWGLTLKLKYHCRFLRDQSHIIFDTFWAVSENLSRRGYSLTLENGLTLLGRCFIPVAHTQGLFPDLSSWAVEKAL